MLCLGNLGGGVDLLFVLMWFSCYVLFSEFVRVCLIAKFGLVLACSLAWRVWFRFVWAGFSVCGCGLAWCWYRFSCVFVCG